MNKPPGFMDIEVAVATGCPLHAGQAAILFTAFKAAELQVEAYRTALKKIRDYIETDYPMLSRAKEIALEALVEKQKCDRQYSLEDSYGYCGMQLGHEGACGRG